MVEWVQAFRTLISTIRGSSHQVNIHTLDKQLHRLISCLSCSLPPSDLDPRHKKPHTHRALSFSPPTPSSLATTFVCITLLCVSRYRTNAASNPLFQCVPSDSVYTRESHFCACALRDTYTWAARDLEIAWRFGAAS